MLQHLVEREAVEDLDEFRVGHSQRRSVVGEQLIVDSPCLFADCHRGSPCLSRAPDTPRCRGRLLAVIDRC